jgi:hypothetical protein
MRVSSPGGLVALTMGLLMLFGGVFALGLVLSAHLPDDSVRFHELAGMRPLTAEAMARTPVGTKALVVGRVSADNPAETVVTAGGRTARFVAYTCRKVDIPPRKRWRRPENVKPRDYRSMQEVEVLPPLAVDAAGGRVWIEGYRRLGGTLHVLEDGPRRTLGRHCEGLAPGDAVTAYGRVVDRPRGRTLDAEAVTTETVDQVVGWSVSFLRILLFSGLVLAPAGLALAAWGAWRLRAASRSRG